MNRNASLLFLAVAISSQASAQAIFVDSRATGAGTGTSWADAFPDLGAALAVAGPGDQLWIAAGTYRPAPPGGDRAATFLVPAEVSLFGGFDGTETSLATRTGLFENTILSGDLNDDDLPGFVQVQDNVWHVVTTPDLATGVVLDGLVVAHGNADKPGTVEGSGAGISLGGDLALRNATVRDNLARKHGAGIFARNATELALDGVTCQGNEADGSGGALHATEGSVFVLRSRFEGNEAGAGGAIVARQALALHETVLIGNRATHSGGAVLAQQAHLDVFRCRFLGNASLGGDGGGLQAEGCSGQVRNSVFGGNQAVRGGGLGCVGVPATGPVPVAIETTVLYANAASDLAGGGGVYGAQPGLAARNTILWGNVGPGGMDVSGQFAGVGALADYCCIQGLTPAAAAALGIGNLAADPGLVDPDGADGVAGTEDDDVRLSPGSPCIDAGSNFAAHGVALDVAGLPRIVDDPATPDAPGGPPPRIDLGPHEFHDLVGSEDEVSVAHGGFAYQEIAVGPAFGGSLYLVLGSASGTHPGLPAGGHLLTLNPDPYFKMTLNEPNHPPLSQSFGVLNGSGKAIAVFTLPPGLDPILIGLELHHAAAILSPSSGAPLLTTTAFPLSLVP